MAQPAGTSLAVCVLITRPWSGPFLFLEIGATTLRVPLNTFPPQEMSSQLDTLPSNFAAAMGRKSGVIWGIKHQGSYLTAAYYLGTLRAGVGHPMVLTPTTYDLQPP